MSSKKSKSIIILLCALAVAGLAYLVFINLERVERIQNGAWSDEARENQYLAAERFLEKYDIESESSRQLIDTTELSTDNVLIIKNANQVVIQSRVDDLIDWVERGGHLIVEAQLNDVEETDILLSHFNVEKFPEDEPWRNADIYDEYLDDRESLTDDIEKEFENGFDEDSDNSEEEGDQAEQYFSDSNAGDLGEALLERQAFSENFSANSFSFSENLRELETYSLPENTVVIRVDNIAYPIRADFSGSGSLYHPAMYRDDHQYNDYQLNYWTDNDLAVGYMQLQVGEGRLSVMADLNIWKSQQIGLFDHAYLLRALVDGADNVLFLTDVSVPGLMSLIWNNFFELCIVLFILGFVWVVYSSRRFGPVLDSNIQPRRSFREHVLAVGDYFWRNKMSEGLIEGLREDIWLTMRKRHPGFDKLDDIRQYNKLSEVTQLPEQTLQGLMQGAAPADEIRFFHAVKTLQKIRKML